MRILMAAAGSRGDVAPLTGLGTALRGAGHDVSLATYGMFENLVTGCGLGFRLVPGDPQLLRAGTPTVSVPMITDQPFWASRVTALGAGPKAVPYKSLSAESLTAAIRDAVTRDSYRIRAQEIAKRLASEDGALPVIRALDRLSA